MSQGVDPSGASTSQEDTNPMMIHKMEELITKQDRIIELLEEIAKHPREGDDVPAPAEQIVDDPVSEQIRIRRLRLYRAALNGDWEVAKHIHQVNNNDIRVGISKRGDTALHIAATAKRIDFVKELINLMTEDEVAQRNKSRGTALCLAAASGMVELARVIINKNEEIATIPDDQMLPIVMAASLGHKEMVDYLYTKTKNYLNEAGRIELLITLIDTDLYDVALKLLDDHPELAIARAENDETALHALARKDLADSNLGSEKLGFFRRYFNHLGTKVVENKRSQALQLVQCIWEKVVLSSDSKISELIRSPSRLIFDAAKHGNVDFLSILIREYPDLIWKLDENDYSIFHYAVLHRQKDIFKLIYQIGSTKDLIVMTTDKKDNNILHLVGSLAPPDRLNIVSGPALQMQRELLWFQEVRKVVQPRHTEAKNKEGFTPRALFTKNHENLREKGEKWMKDTATSCMLVATLIATVVFAASITVPGGNIQDKEQKGLPIFVGKVSFKIFAVADAISLVSSTASIANFLSILTSRYAEDDFLRKLPRKLLIGLATLFISIAAMMVVFSATFFILFSDGRLWIAIFATTIASFPVILFIWQHFQLFFDVQRSICVSDFLVQQGKSDLFYKEGEASKRQNAKQFSVNCFEICSVRCESPCCANV